jgi:hypothetical protein
MTANQYLQRWGAADELRSNVERDTGGRVRWLAGSGVIQLRIGGSPVISWPCTDDPALDIVRLWAGWSQRIRKHSRGVSA